MTLQTDTANNRDNASSVLHTLRRLLPPRPLHFTEALRIAELQANRLLELRGMTDDVPVTDHVVTDLPRITIEYETDMPYSGVSDWHDRRRVWVITLNASEPDTRRRLSLLHEYKHIIDHGSAGLVDLGDRTYFGRTPVEYLADYFAGCVLMPKRLVRRAWADGIQRTTDLAELFDVSTRAMTVRLSQLHLRQAPPSYQRCTPREIAFPSIWSQHAVRNRRPIRRTSQCRQASTAVPARLDAAADAHRR